MLNELLLWPEKIRQGMECAELFFSKHKFFLEKKPRQIAFFGMGGSGIVGRICKELFEKNTKIAFHVMDSMYVPACLKSNSLSIITSYSGNTWEALAAAEILVQSAMPIIIVTHGGELANFAKKNNIPMIIIPESLTPRTALGVFLGFFCHLFTLTGYISANNLLEQWLILAEKYIKIFDKKDFFDDFITIAQPYDVMHVWGVSGNSGSVGYRAATQFNENSKMQAVYNSFPEVCHNLIVGFESKRQEAFVLMFCTDFVSIIEQKVLSSLENIIREKRVILYKTPVFGDTSESQFFFMILWADFASYYLGMARKVSIEKVEIIDRLKKNQKVQLL